jgi:hypothetical protein
MELHGLYANGFDTSPGLGLQGSSRRPSPARVRFRFVSSSLTRNLRGRADSEALERLVVALTSGSFRFVSGSFFHVFIDSKQLLRFVLAFRAIPPGGALRTCRRTSSPRGSNASATLHSPPAAQNRISFMLGYFEPFKVSILGRPNCGPNC